jgi:hypothetical protein
MSDKQYVVVANCGLEGMIFRDLVYVKNGQVLPVKHKMGERIEIENIPANTLEQSLIIGSLGKAIAGKIVEVRSGEEASKSVLVDAKEEKVEQGQDPLHAFVNTPRNKPELIATDKGINLYGEPKKEEHKFSVNGANDQDVQKAGQETSQAQAAQSAADKKEVVNKEFFEKPYLEQLKFVKACEDIALLESILADCVSTNGSRQLKNNTTRRIATLKKK